MILNWWCSRNALLLCFSIEGSSILFYISHKRLEPDLILLKMLLFSSKWMTVDEFVNGPNKIENMKRAIANILLFNT